MQPTPISQPVYNQPINVQPTTIAQPTTFAQPTTIAQPTTFAQPTTIAQPPIVQSTTITQPTPITQPIGLQHASTLPVTSQPIYDSTVNPSLQDPQADFIPYADPIRSDFGKIKALEILAFKEAELERMLSGDHTFASVGNLEVLYFANYDRFVLSLNDWKYPLLRRVPIVGSGPNHAGPVEYKLPTYNGYYILRLNKIPHLEAVQNFETILMNNSKFTYQGTENILQRELSPDDRFRGQVEPIPGDTTGSLGNLDAQPITEVGPGPLSRKDRMKRGFQKIGFKLTKGLSRKGKHNLNALQLRDIDSMKRTSEITVPTHFYPRKEVERWISYSKEIANRNGFEPELGSEGFDSSPYDTGRMRGYGSVDLGQGNLSNPLSSKALSMGITTDRPESLNLYNNRTGTIGASTVKSRTYTKPHFMDKVKSKLPGTHHYHGEKVDGNTYSTHSNVTHPGLMDKMKTKIVGHEPFPHQGLANPSTGVTGISGIAGTQSLYTQQLPQGTTYIGGPIYAEPTSHHDPNLLAPGTVISTNVVSSVPIEQHLSLKDKIVGAVTGHPQGQTFTNNPVIGQGQTLASNVTQPTMLAGQAPIQNVVTQGERIQNNLASHIPTQHVDVLRAQEYLAHDQA